MLSEIIFSFNTICPVMYKSEQNPTQFIWSTIVSFSLTGLGIPQLKGFTEFTEGKYIESPHTLFQK